MVIGNLLDLGLIGNLIASDLAIIVIGLFFIVVLKDLMVGLAIVAMGFLINHVRNQWSGLTKW